MNSTEVYYYLKENVGAKEYRMYKYIHNLELKFVPKLYSYDKNKKTLKTQRINGLTIADLYGEDFCKVPKRIITQIRAIIKYLYNIGIIYPDITGYNFIQDKQSRVWIIDFEHCFYTNKYNNQMITNVSYHLNEANANKITDKDEHLNFVYGFCFKGQKSWNPYFS